MFCKHCGKTVSETDSYCPHCKEDLLGTTVRKPKTSVFTKIIIGIAVVFGGVFFLGIIAAIAIPKFANTKEKAYVAAMRSDLRNLASAEHAYFTDHRTFTDSLAALRFRPSGAVVVTVTDARPTGWAAQASHPEAAATCRVGWGADSIANVGDGAIQCLMR